MTGARGIVALRVLIAVAIVVFLALALRDNLSQLTQIRLDPSPGWIAPALVLAVAATALLPVGWRLLVLGQRGIHDLSTPLARGIWWRSQSARFLPTGVAGMAARIYLAGRAGISREVATLTVGEEIAALVGWSSLVGGVVVADAVPGVVRWTAVTAGALIVAGLPVGAMLWRRARGGTSVDLILMVRAVAVYGVSVGLKAGRAVLVAAAAFGWDPALTGAVVAADALGAVAGILSIAPSGIGTREAAIVAVGTPALGAGDALALAVVLRVVDLVVEVGWLGWSVARDPAPESAPRTAPDSPETTMTTMTSTGESGDSVVAGGADRPVVLHLTSSFPRSATDHVAPFLIDLVGTQRTGGWDARVVSTHDVGLPTRHDVAGIPVRRVRYAPARWEVLAYRGGGHAALSNPLHVLLLPGLMLAMLVVTWREARRSNAAVVVAHWLAPSGLVLALLPLKARRVLTMHGNDVALAAKLPWLARFVASRVDAVVGVSDAVVRDAAAILGCSPADLPVVRLPLPAGLDPRPFPVAADPPRLLLAGRASTEKGLDVAIEALADPRVAHWYATLVCDGPERPELERLARKCAPGRVTARGAVPREELFGLIETHHAVGVPSRREGLGLFALESVALGRRVVASDVGGLPEVVEDGADGALVPAGDPKAFAAALAVLPLTPPQGLAADRHRPDAVLAAAARAYFP